MLYVRSIVLLVLLCGAVAYGQTTSPFFLLDSNDVRNTTNPRVEVDANNATHAVYPAHAIGDAFYAYCPASCDTLAHASIVTLRTDGTVNNAMLALDANGTPHVLLSTYQSVYYASCSGDCRQDSAWRVDLVLNHQGAYEVSGEAFALDPQGRPRFVMHPYRSLSPLGNAAPATFLVTCDAACQNGSSWRSHQISEQLWQETSLRFAANGAAHVATTVTIEDVGDAIAYFTCAANCSGGEDFWNGVGLYRAFSDPYVSEITPVVSLALTRDGRPRMLALGDDEMGGRTLIYFSCEQACTENASWLLNALLTGAEADAVGPGLDLTLDRNDQPRFVYTADYNILMALCDADCAQGDGWGLEPVELSTDLAADPVIPYYNCAVSAWFLSQPSLAIGSDGRARVAYRAQDVSGAYGVPDPNYASCNTSADMTLTRFAQLGTPSQLGTPTPATATPVAAPSSSGLPSGPFGAISIGGVRSAVIAAKDANAQVVYHTYVVDVPLGTGSLDIRLDGNGDDIDIVIKAGSEIASYAAREAGGDWDYLDFSVEPNPSYRYNNPPAGPLYIDVVNVLERPLTYTLSVTGAAVATSSTNAPSGSLESLAPINPLSGLAGSPVAAPAITPTPLGTIGPVTLGQTLRNSLAPRAEGVSYHTYTVDVPAGTRVLVITLDADLDLDLAAKYGSEILSYRDQAEGGDWGYRDISVDTSTQLRVPNPQAGIWYIDVINALREGEPSPYTLSIGTE